MAICASLASLPEEATPDCSSWRTCPSCVVTACIRWLICPATDWPCNASEFCISWRTAESCSFERRLAVHITIAITTIAAMPKASQTAGLIASSLSRCAGELDERLGRGVCRGAGVESLGRAPSIDGRNLVHAGHGAARGTGFFGEEFAVALLIGVFHDRNARIAALLRAVVDQAVFADVEIARACAAAPVVFPAARDVVLEFIYAREGLFFERDNFFENFLFARV